MVVVVLVQVNVNVNVKLNFCDVCWFKNPISIFGGRQKPLENWVHDNKKQAMPINVLV